MANEASVTLADVRKGVVTLYQAGVSLLDVEGTNHTATLVDLLLDSNLDRFNACISQLGYNPKLTGQVLSDATLAGWDNDGILYLDGLVQDAQGISAQKGVPYCSLRETDEKLPSFLYRPPARRQLMVNEKMCLVYHDIEQQISSENKNVDWVLDIDKKGLQKVLRVMLESSGGLVDEAQVIETWQALGWMEYAWEEYGSSKGVVRDSTHQVSEFNHPSIVEYIASDIRNYSNTGFNLRELVNLTEVVLPFRQEVKLSSLTAEASF